MTARETDLLAEALVDIAAAPRATGLSTAALSYVKTTIFDDDTTGRSTVVGVAAVSIEYPDGVGSMPARWTAAFAAEVVAAGRTPARNTTVLVATVAGQPIVIGTIQGNG